MARNGRKRAIYQIQILMINLWFSQDQARPQGTFFNQLRFWPVKHIKHLNLRVVKVINKVGKKMTRNGPTAAIFKFSFISEQSI